MLYWSASALLLVSSAATLLVAWWHVRSYGLRPATTLVEVFVLLDSLGLIFLPFLGNLPLPYLPEARSAYIVGDASGEVIYVRHVASHLLVQMLMVFYLVILRTRGSLSREGILFYLFRRVIRVSLWVAVPLAVFFYFRYFVLGPGLELLRGFRLSYSDTVEAVTARSLAAAQLDFGQGAFGALMAAFVVWPWLASVFAIRSRLSVVFWPLWGVLFVLSLAYALQMYQKAPILVIVLIYGAIAVSWYLKCKRRRWTPSPKAWRRAFLFIALLSFLGGTILYVVNFGLHPIEAVVATLGRVFLVPSNTEAYWFWVYPDRLPFWGLGYAIMTNLGIIQQTAFEATGDIFSANASFVAVGWSGAGFFGVLLNGVILIIYAHLVDLVWPRLDPSSRSLALGLLLSACFWMVSGTIGDFLVKGGLTPLLLAWSLSRGVPMMEKKHEGSLSGAPKPESK